MKMAYLRTFNEKVALYRAALEKEDKVKFRNIVSGLKSASRYEENKEKRNFCTNY